jgi:DUF971 family protein
MFLMGTEIASEETRIEPTGNYAVVLFFSDGHDSGIYSWEHLYKLATEQDKL